MTLRTETEWIELVEHGWNLLANLTDDDTILESICLGRSAGSNIKSYGDGEASNYTTRKIGDVF